MWRAGPIEWISDDVRQMADFILRLFLLTRPWPRFHAAQKTEG